MTKTRSALAFVLLLSTLAGCGGASYLNVASRHGGQSIAVVSLGVERLGRGFGGGWRDVTRSPFMTGYAREMVHATEQHLAAHYAVVPAEEFIASDEYQGLAQHRPDVALPDYEGWEMPFFGYNRSHLVKARVAPEMAQALAAAAGTDLIAIVYSEWGAKTGGFIPTSKALVRTTLTIHDASGRLIYAKRYQAMGRRTLGAFGSVALDESTIEEWMDAFVRTVAEMTSR